MTFTGKASIYGVIGHPISHSLSPVFQNSAFSYLGLEAVYIPMDIPPEKLETAFRGLKALVNMRGLNVTIPHKEDVIHLLDEVSEEARSIGAVNTIIFEGGRAKGDNTDWVGFLKALREIVEPEDKRALVLGAGGASRAVVYALKRVGAEVFIWNRTYEKARKLADEFGLKAIRDAEEAVKRMDIIVNTTSVGLKEDDPWLFDYRLIRPDHTVVDIIYRETHLVKMAKQAGASYQTGFPMLVYQGAESFRLWTGCEPPLKIMKKSLSPYGYPKDCSRIP